MKNTALVSALQLYDYIFRNFWDGHAIVGPDSGLMLQLRFLRFLKNHFSSIRRSERHFFLQSQGYWIKSNWDLFDITGEFDYKRVAIECTKNVLRMQKNDGSWEYPLKEWGKFVSTVEGTWGSLGLLETYRQTSEPAFLKGALGWYDFLTTKIGFQHYRDSYVINYFDVQKSRKVPNNTTLVLWFMAELYRATQDRSLLKLNDKMIRFLELCQKRNGELTYEVGREHYLCYHYNAFEFLDLFHYNEIVGNERVRIILEKLTKFLKTGITEIGSVKYNCTQTYPEHIMYSAVVGAALTEAATMGLQDCQKYAEIAFDFLLKNQRPDGSFAFSKHDFPYVMKPISHGFLVDENSYPRPLSFILQHLLTKTKKAIDQEPPTRALSKAPTD
jgi:hypothetical protein